MNPSTSTRRPSVGHKPSGFYYLIFVLYNSLFVPLLWIGVRVAGLFHAKIAAGLRGRRHFFATLTARLAHIDPSAPRLWIHISSMGEFEQAKPVLRQLKARHPGLILVVSFFSPSGYEHAGDCAEADVTCYLPLDSFFRARRFVRLVCPSVAVVVRHDIWPNHQWRLQKERIPIFLIDASLSDHRYRQFRRLRWILQPIYTTFTHILTVSDDHVRRFQTLFALERVSTCGDTRYDQVHWRAHEEEKIDFLKQTGTFDRQKCFIAGSTWPSDEEIVLPAAARYLDTYPDHTAIIAPHETTVDHIEAIEHHLQTYGLPVCRLTEMKNGRSLSCRVMIVDQIGLLANVYALGALVYVGGSRGPGIHNILEPAAHQSAVIFGPRYHNSVEAVEMVQQQAATVVHTADQVFSQLDELGRGDPRVDEMGKRARTMVDRYLGATTCTIKAIETVLPDNA